MNLYKCFTLLVLIDYIKDRVVVTYSEQKILMDSSNVNKYNNR